MGHIFNHCISVRTCLGRIFRDERGQGIIEYSFILLLIVVVVFVMVKGIGSTTNKSLEKVNSAFNTGS